MTSKAAVAGYIQSGLNNSHVREDQLSYIKPVGIFGSMFLCCGLGMALIGKFGTPERAHSVLSAELKTHKDNAISAISSLLDIPFELTHRIDFLHHYDSMPAKDIASIPLREAAEEEAAALKENGPATPRVLQTTPSLFEEEHEEVLVLA